MKAEPTTIIVGIETLAILFQGGTVVLDGVTLLPDRVIANAADFAEKLQRRTKAKKKK